MNSERPPTVAGDGFAASDEVQARTQALWPQAAAAAGLPEAGAKFRRMQSNRRLQQSRCVLEIATAAGQRFVLRADFQSDNPLRRVRDLERHGQVARQLKSVPGVSVPEVLWQDPEHPYVLMEFVPGETAYRALALTDYGFGARADVLRRIGGAVAELHRVSDAGQKQFWPKPFLKSVSDRAQAVREGQLQLPKPNRFLGLCAHLHRAARRARGCEFRSAVAHGDLHLRNIILSDQEVSFIDFLNHKAVFPQRDLADIWLANCLEHLAAEDSVPGFGLVAQADWAAFEEGYGAGLTGDPVFRFFFAWRLFRLWLSLGAKPPEERVKTQMVAVWSVRVLDALLADEAD
ncbi:aminoglycoside phosphotransferase family protein [Leisingera sp. SS27]|uniref:aminoglycoside phosphotransferase family protein n=1 Tax=Leisingera sp. SS27 TaxID=2979462 RepID=UPI00232B22A6|nr:aminoglycoside phosphotransferase family protein [Leisingera sp. SS27]MDC0658847.1 aminoglycoside phosphotransferase family protein [Leisingera sp. SS27]